ncbi:MAG: hypothetical protein JSV42_15260 [Chloroflexota bacterium]|nr:MAG: hypothetical protein JSV42_15260 [Chloroflexota bacterium]
MFRNVLINENMKIIKRRLFWVEIALLGLIVMGILVALYITIGAARDGIGMPSEERLMLLEMITWTEALLNVLRFAGWDGFGPLFLIVLVGAVTAQEYTWRALHVCLARGVSRPLLATAKLTTFLISAVTIVLVVLLVGSLVTALTSMKINGSLQLGKLDLQLLFFSVLRTIFTLLPFGALTFLLAVASRSAVVAISGGLAYTLLLEPLIMQTIGLLDERWAKLGYYLPGSLAESLLSLNNAALAAGGSPGIGYVSPLNAAIGIGAWTLFFAGLSLWIFQRQDFTD